MMSLGAAKLVGMIFESMGYGEHSASVFFLLFRCACPHYMLS